jgi:hypothetical protein
MTGIIVSKQPDDSGGGAMRYSGSPTKRAKYSEVAPTLRTGDKVLFSGAGRFSQAIKMLTGCGWSHVAMIYVPEKGMRPQLWESCNNGVAFAQMDEQFLDPKTSMRTAEPGDVVIRHLQCGDDDQRRLQALFTRVCAELLGRPYEKSSIELLRAALAPVGLGNEQAVLDSVFCSELIAETDQRLGVLPFDRPSNAFRPKDYIAGGLVDKLMLSTPYRLGPEILLEDRCA